MAATRFDPNGTTTKPPSWALDMLLAPGSGYGWSRDQGSKRGNMKATPISTKQLIEEGSGKYGLTAWDAMFDDSGKLTDKDAFLRSMNFGAVTSHPGDKGHQGNTSGYDFGAAIAGPLSFSDNPAPRFEYGSDPLEQWLYDISYHGRDRGRSWPFGRNKVDVPGYWFDPQDIRFTGDEFGGDLDSLTYDDLNRWAQDTYGADLLTVAASSPELLETRQQWMEDPSLWWDSETPGQIPLSSIPGLAEADAQARLGAYQDEFKNRAARSESLAERTSSQYLNALLAANPRLMDTGLGAALAQTMPAAGDALRAANDAGSPIGNYDYGLINAVQPYLTDQYIGRTRLGG